MNIQQIKEKYTCLDWLGEKVVRRTNDGYLARCPWREDNHPSLTVTSNGKGWKDQKTGEHGNLIDMVMKCLNTNSLSRVCEEFSRDEPNHFSPNQLKTLDNKEYRFMFFTVVPLTTRALYAYLHNRKVNIEIAKQLLQEAHYSFEQRSDGSYLYALAYKNDKDGYELRSQIFKGSKSPKTITTHWLIDDAPIVVFEGFFDMLSFATLCGVVKHNYLVLNSTVNAPAAIEKLKEFQGKIFLCLDNDEGGCTATKLMLEQLPDAVDIRGKFAPYKDVNEYLVQCDKITTPHANSKCSKNNTPSEPADAQGGCDENTTLSTSIECVKNDTPNHTEYAPMKNTQGQPNGRGQTAPVSEGVSMSCESGACTGRSCEGLLAVPSPVGHSDACIGSP